MLVQSREYLDSTRFQNEVNRKRETPQQHPAHTSVLHLIKSRIGRRSVDRRIKLEYKFDTQARLFVFVPSCGLFRIRGGLWLDVNRFQERRSRVNKRSRTSLHGRPDSGAAR